MMPFGRWGEDAAGLKGVVLDRTGPVGVLSIAGDLTLQRAAQLREILMVSLEQADYLVVDLKEVSEVDVYCMQVICSAHRISMRTNKRLTVTGINKDVLLQTADEMGHLCAADCAARCRVPCPWSLSPAASSN